MIPGISDLLAIFLLAHTYQPLHDHNAWCVICSRRSEWTYEKPVVKMYEVHLLIFFLLERRFYFLSSRKKVLSIFFLPERRFCLFSFFQKEGSIFFLPERRFYFLSSRKNLRLIFFLPKRISVNFLSFRTKKSICSLLQLFFIEIVVISVTVILVLLFCCCQLKEEYVSQCNYQC